MDLSQSKITKQEWESLEVPVNEREKNVLDMLNRGYADPAARHNDHKSLLRFLKMDGDSYHQHLYQKHFHERIQTTVRKYCPDVTYTLPTAALKKLNSVDLARLNNLDKNIDANKDRIFEFTLIDLCYHIAKNHKKKRDCYVSYLYSLVHVLRVSIDGINTGVLSYANAVIAKYYDSVKPKHMIRNAARFIEQNEYVSKYRDQQLYAHQQDIYRVFSDKDVTKGSFVTYCAPTGTGKTLTPIGLANGYRIIFVCVARHIGMSLARSAISVGRKVAFAFGCKTDEDIRLHYFAAKDYERNWKSGGIYRVDNSVGDNVEILICDVKSYLISMEYMLRFGPAEGLIVFWDEPTITLEREEHPLHEVISRNWNENKIPNMILSCATLPDDNEIRVVKDRFVAKFPGTSLHDVRSNDYTKSIPLISRDGKCVLIHNLCESYEDMREVVQYCIEHSTLLRYFDLGGVADFLNQVHKDGMVPIEHYFTNIEEITMDSIKMAYLNTLAELTEEQWKKARETAVSRDAAKFPDASDSGVLFTTTDAHTLTDGPTIYLCEDTMKMANFYLQQSRIPASVLDDLTKAIETNNSLYKKITNVEHLIEQEFEKTDDPDGKGKGKNIGKSRLSNDGKRNMAEINRLRRQVMAVTLDDRYIPNTRAHQNVWVGLEEYHEQAFSPRIDEESAAEIMSLGVDNMMKILLLLGIGVLRPRENSNKHYDEIMKRLANDQRLFIIVASSDYIYGTNYQFCHGVIGKDLTEMTQQKTIQSLGRIGRGHIQHTYSARFRDDSIYRKLFHKQATNIEADNMCRLLGGDVAII